MPTPEFNPSNSKWLSQGIEFMLSISQVPDRFYSFNRTTRKELWSTRYRGQSDCACRGIILPQSAPSLQCIPSRTKYIGKTARSFESCHRNHMKSNDGERKSVQLRSRAAARNENASLPDVASGWLAGNFFFHFSAPFSF